MKKLIIAALAVCFIAGVSTTASAVVLVPGDVVGPFLAPTPAGAPIVTLTQPIAYDFIAGSVTQNVYLNGTGYLFEYKFSNFAPPASLNAIWRMTATNFAGFFTDVGADGTGVMPLWIDRSLVGDSVGFQFFAPLVSAGVTPGSITSNLWIQTNAQYYGPGTANFIDGGVTGVPLYAPAIPEPASMLLLGMGMGVLGFLRKRRNA